MNDSIESLLDFFEEPMYWKKVLGRDGKEFLLPKLRTMVSGSDQMKTQLIQSNGFDSLGKIHNDPRITYFGRFLRRNWIDELPQFYSLSTGDLGLVGVRPKSSEEWKHYPQEHMEQALRYKPGLFGVHYYDISLSHFENESRYLGEKAKNHDVDRKYFLGIVYNIIFKGVRSR